MRKGVVLILILAAAAAGLGFTKQGRTVLAHVGLAKACDGGGCD